MKWLNMPIMALLLFLMLYATGGLPDHADPQAPANTHVSPTYIEDSVKATHTPNVVTAVLADYRGYDTLGEAVVIFTAGLACVLILMKRKANDKRTISEHHRSDDL